MKTKTENKQDDAPNFSAVRDCPDSAGSVHETRKMPAMVYYYDEDGERQCLGRVEVNIEEPDMLDGEDVEEYWHQMNERSKKWILEDLEVDILDALIADSQNGKVTHK